jgi:hypothetical protein
VQVLTINALLSAQPTKLGNTEYFQFAAETANNKPIRVMLSENLLLNAGYSRSALHQLFGATLYVGDTVDQQTGAVTSAAERVNRVLNGEIYPPTGKPYTFVLATAVSDSVSVTDEAIEHRNNVDVKVQVEITIERERTRLKEQAQRARERAIARQQAQMKLQQPPVTNPEPTPETTEAVAPEEVAPVAEDSPF